MLQLDPTQGYDITGWLGAALSILTIYSHYVGVSRALRETAAAVADIDWAVWQRSRF